MYIIWTLVVDGVGLLVERFVGVFSGVVFLVAVILMVQLAGCVVFGIFYSSWWWFQADSSECGAPV